MLSESICDGYTDVQNENVNKASEGLFQWFKPLILAQQQLQTSGEEKLRDESGAPVWLGGSVVAYAHACIAFGTGNG